MASTMACTWSSIVIFDRSPSRDSWPGSVMAVTSWPASRSLAATSSQAHAPSQKPGTRMIGALDMAKPPSAGGAGVRGASLARVVDEARHESTGPGEDPGPVVWAAGFVQVVVGPVVALRAARDSGGDVRPGGDSRDREGREPGQHTEREDQAGHRRRECQAEGRIDADGARASEADRGSTHAKQ